MNIVRMTGGLGNQMFQYALCLKCRKRGIDCKIEDWTEYENRDNARPLFLKSAFGIEYDRASEEEYVKYTDSYMDPMHRILRKIRGRKTLEYRERSLEYDEQILNLDGRYLVGFFQTDKYFDDIKEDIYKCYDFTSEVKKEAMKFLDKIVINDNAVSIHVRRGDYVTLSDEYGGICTEDYYRKAIKYIKEKTDSPHFIFFSNDTGWTNEFAGTLLSDSEFSVFEGTNEDNGYIDMYLMSECHHHIIANSSFSWWGAYLSGKKYSDGIVIAPSRWSNIAKRQDIYSSNMILM